MRILPGTVRAGGLAALASLTMACNAILGVEDVAALSPDSGQMPVPSACDVASDFMRVMSDPSTSLLSRTSDGSPGLLFLLDTDPKPDSLFMALFDGKGGHGALSAPGTYALTASDAQIGICGICIEVNADFDSSTSTFSQTFWADPQGTLTISRADNTGLAGRIQGLKFRHVNIANGISSDIDDGCSVTVEDVEFDLSYSSSVNAARFTGIARRRSIAR